MTFGSPTYIALAQPSRVADYVRGLRERCKRYDADLAPLPVEITLTVYLLEGFDCQLLYRLSLRGGD